MKKAAIFTSLSLLIAALCLTFPSCNSKKQNEPSESETQLGTASENEHLAGKETETKTETETEKVTETKTEKTEVEAPTETEKKDPPIEFLQESLRYNSNGNGTCSVSGIGNYSDLFVVIPERSPAGDIVTGIEDRAFYGNKTIKAVEIPSTVSSIGNMAFGDCASLIYISVDNNNKMFTDIDGVLYTADETKLILFPANCGYTSVEISKDVTAIAAMAFYNCKNLEEIRYGGSVSDWSKILIGDMNYGLYTASLVCGNKK